MTTLGRFVIRPDHPALPGHFPGNPLVPGVVLLDEALALIRQHLPGVTTALRVKFTAVVRAGEAIEVRLIANTVGGLSFTALRDDIAVMSGSLRRDPPA
jgi:3-hydroxyacyl-[acyl-carrier-protein] dehydratase